ncbi:MAG: xanthine dehydrogenase accessory protein XdhC [Pseudomonadales bacterium]|jgi:xanthine dehydrogenase accessory factor|nr:xanthine dehydrogenase accessory protein XdhC [Pseudomonadales bacterium]
METPLPWDTALVRCRAALEACVLATVLGTSGSAPRDPGAKMVVTREESFDTLGGGRLEALVIEAARAMLAGDGPAQAVEHFPLGEAAQQCCGGAVTVLLERIAPALTPLALFGAGHVGQALVRILAELPFHVIWIDPRAERMPAAAPANVRPVVAADPVVAVEDLPEHVPALVMTHDHALDQRLVSILLRRSDRAFVGLIASDVKAARFRMRLGAEGIDEARLARLVSPVGLREVPGKEPMAVAVSIAAQLLQQVRTARVSTTPEAGRRQGLRWRDARLLLDETKP